MQTQMEYKHTYAAVLRCSWQASKNIMKYSGSLSVVWVLPASAFLAPLCVFVCTREEEILSVCMLASAAFRLLLVDIFSVNMCSCRRVCWRLYVCCISLFVLSRLCVIGSEPAEPFVCALPCAYIIYVAPLNSQVDKLGARLWSSLFSAPNINSTLFPQH